MPGIEPGTSSLPRKRSTPELHRLTQGFERETRLELATPTLEGLCSTNWAIPACLLLRVKIIVGREGLLESCGFSWTRLRLGSNLRILLTRSPMLKLSIDVGLLSVEDACSGELKRNMAAKSLLIRTWAAGGEYIWNDPLEWWNKNQIAYPILARLAMIYLAVQATSAPSERIFSLASRIISNRRTRMDSGLAGKMLFVSENWKWWQGQLDFYKATEDGVDELMEE